MKAMFLILSLMWMVECVVNDSDTGLILSSVFLVGTAILRHIDIKHEEIKQ